MTKSQQFLADQFLICPETSEKQKIVDVSTDPAGFSFVTCGKTTAWKHTIRTEEIDPDKYQGVSII